MKGIAASLGFVVASFALYASEPEGWNPFQEVKPETTAAAPERQIPERLKRMELTGIMTFDGEHTFSVHDAVGKRSYWLLLNEAQDGIRVVAFDEGKQEVTIRFNGLERNIGLNSNSIVTLKVAPPAASPDPEGAVASSTVAASKRKVDNRPEEIKRKEEEARWLVSDLLVIGMEEREKRRAEREQRELEIKSRLAAARREQSGK